MFAISTAYRRRGGAMIEFALSFLFFLALVFSIVELGRGAWAYGTIAHATRQGARFAQIRGTISPATAAQVEAVVASHITGLDTTGLTVTTTWEPAIERGGIVQVRSRYVFPFWLPSLVVENSSVTLGATSRMIVAN